MPEVQLTEPLDHAAEKGGFRELLATVEAAVEADVEALLGPGRVDTKDFETLTRAVRRRRSDDMEGFAASVSFRPRYFNPSRPAGRSQAALTVVFDRSARGGIG